jgi:hypothetical protein
MILKLEPQAVKALTMVFLKSLTEQTNVEKSLVELDFFIVEGKGDKVLKYLDINNPPTSISFKEDLKLEEE